MDAAQQKQGQSMKTMEIAEMVNQSLSELSKKRLKFLCSESNVSQREKKYDCEICHDTGWVEIEKDGYIYAQKCKCNKYDRDILESKLRFATIPEEFKDLTIEKFETDCYSPGKMRDLAEIAKNIAKRYVELFDEIVKDGKGLYFYSTKKGSGKTRLAVSIANELIHKKGVFAKFATTIQILDQIKSTWDEKNASGETEQSLIKNIISAQVLVIDDIGVEQPKDWINERFYNILNGRMIEKKITIFTSNCRIEDLKLDERIKNRILKMAVSVEFPNESIRIKKAEEENTDLLFRLLGE